MAKIESRPKRWQKAIEASREKMQKLADVADDVTVTLGELEEIRLEYEEWRDNLPENLQNSALGDKLNQIVDIDFASYSDDGGMVLDSYREVENILDEAEGADLPRGFGRD